MIGRKKGIKEDHGMMGMIWRKTVGRRGGVDTDDALSVKEEEM